MKAQTVSSKNKEKFLVLEKKTLINVKSFFVRELLKYVFKEEARTIRNAPFKGVPGTTAKSKMELFVTKVKDFQPLFFVTKSSNLDFAVVLDTPLFFFSLLTINSQNMINDHQNLANSGKDVQSKKKTSLSKSKQNYK